MSPAIPSSCRRFSASTTRPSRIRSPALSWATRLSRVSHSGVAYSGWLPTSRYRRAPFFRNTLDERPQDTTRRNRYRATSSGDSRRWPWNVHVTPYSFSNPKIRRSMSGSLCEWASNRPLPARGAREGTDGQAGDLPAAGDQGFLVITGGFPLVVAQPVELSVGS